MARNSDLFQVFIKSLPQSASLTAPSSEGACFEGIFIFRVHMLFRWRSVFFFASI